MRCTVQNGIEALQLYDLDVNPWPQVIALGGCVIVYRLLAYVVLRAAKSHWELGDIRRKFGGSGNGQEKTVARQEGVVAPPGEDVKVEENKEST